MDSTTADNHKSTLGTGSNDLENDTGAYTNPYCGQVEDAFWMFGNSIDTGNVAANISGSDCVIDPVLGLNYFLIVTVMGLLMMKIILIVTFVCLRMNLICIHGLNFNCISLDFVDHGHTCQPFCLENDSFGTCLVQDSTFENVMGYLSSTFDKPSEFQKIWSLLSKR